MGRALAGKRGCGTRVAGGCYVESGTAENGVPIEYLIVDEPQGESSTGTAEWFKPHRTPLVVTHGDVNHLVVWVGEEFYPNPFDFIEETRVLGASRRLPSTFDFSVIGPHSRMIFVHPRALTDAKPIEMLECPCPRHALRGGLAIVKPAHTSFEVSHKCIGASLYMPKDQITRPGITWDDRSQSDISTNVRAIPCGHVYRVFELPDVLDKDALKPRPGVFLQVAITGVAMVRQKDGSFDPKIAERIRKAGVETFECDE
jgi:hypothetical protein